MGKLVAFWSPYEGKAKVTSSLCAVAGMLGMEYPELSIAISHIGSDCMELGEKLDCRHRHNIKEEIYGKAGITSVKLNFRQSVLSSDKIRRSAVPLLMKSLFFYPNAEEKRYDELTDYIVTQVIPGEFDALLLDLKSGFNGYSKRFLEAADFLIVVLPQDPRAWENFMLRESEYMSGKKYFILLGGYLENSKFGRKYFLRNKE